MSDPANNSDELQVVPAEVTDAGTFVQLTADELINGLNSLDRDINALLDTWKGNAADDYAAGWEETRQGVVTVLDALTKIAELLGVNSRTFATQDTSNAEGFGSLSIQI